MLAFPRSPCQVNYGASLRLRCNGLLEPIGKASIRDRLPPRTQQHYDEFAICQTCGNLYWKGAHYQHLQQLIDRVRQQPSCNAV